MDNLELAKVVLDYALRCETCSRDYERKYKDLLEEHTKELEKFSTKTPLAKILMEGGLDAILKMIERQEEEHYAVIFEHYTSLVNIKKEIADKLKDGLNTPPVECLIKLVDSKINRTYEQMQVYSKGIGDKIE